MDKIMMWVMAICALIGGVDQLAGNKFGLGRRFEDGFQLLGPTALSMAGLICITPLLSLGLEHTVVPLYRILHLDPGMLGGVLAIDMGGYQLCKELAQDPAIGRYGGIIVGATLGCTITFTIPVGMGMLGEREKPLFAKGILAGLCMLPVGILTGGLMCGVSLGKLLFQSIPVLILAILLVFGISRFPDGMIHGFRIFATVIRSAGTIGIAFGAFSYMTGLQLLPGLTPLDEALKVVSSIGIVLLGSLPFGQNFRMFYLHLSYIQSMQVVYRLICSPLRKVYLHLRFGTICLESLYRQVVAYANRLVYVNNCPIRYLENNQLLE